MQQLRFTAAEAREQLRCRKYDIDHNKDMQAGG